jgi:hypothetical protein
MRQLTIFSVQLLIFWSCGGTKINSPTGQKSADEKFDIFFSSFSKKKTFQDNRVLFPLTIVSIDDDRSDSTQKKSISEWQFVNFDSLQRSNSSNQLLFKTISDDYTEVVFSVKGTGVYVRHTFRKINNKWLLTRIIDESD